MEGNRIHGVGEVAWVAIWFKATYALSFQEDSNAFEDDIVDSQEQLPALSRTLCKSISQWWWTNLIGIEVSPEDLVVTEAWSDYEKGVTDSSQILY